MGRGTEPLVVKSPWLPSKRSDLRLARTTIAKQLTFANMSHTHNGHSEPAASADHGHNGHGRATPDSFEVRILRQDGPGQASYWERHKVTYEPDMNVISVLQKVAARATASDGKKVAPVAWDCNCLEEVCGACTMVINGKVRQS